MLITRPRSGVLKPSYFLLIDRRMRAVVLLVRGTQSVKVRMLSLSEHCCVALSSMEMGTIVLRSRPPPSGSPSSLLLNTFCAIPIKHKSNIFWTKLCCL